MNFMMEKLKKHWILSFLLIIGFFLRIWNLGTQSLWFDESISSIAALALLEKGRPIFDSGFLYSRAILNTVFIAASFKIFGVSEFAGRFPSVIFGVLTIGLVYVIGTKWGNKRVGIIAAILLTFSVWEIAWSRQARMYQQLQFFYILSLYLFYELWASKNIRILLPLGLSFAAALLSHIFGYSLLVIFLLYLFLYYCIENRGKILSKKIDWKKNIFPLAIAGLCLLILAKNLDIIFNVLHTKVNYYDNYIYLLKKDLGLFLFLAVPGGTVIVEKDWKKGLLLILAIVLPLYFIFFHVLLFATRYLYFVTPLLFLLIGFFLDFLISFLQKQLERVFFQTSGTRNSAKPGFMSRALKRISISKVSTSDKQNLSKKPNVVKRDRKFINRKFLRKNISMIFIFSILICSLHYSSAFTYTPKTYYDLGVNAPQSNFKEAYACVKANWSENDVIISAWTAPAKYYLGKNDYWLAFNVDGRGAENYLNEGTSQDVYTNASAIKDVQELGAVINNSERGWIVVDNLAWQKLSSDIKNYINKYTRQEMSTKSVKVYSWNSSTFPSFGLFKTPSKESVLKQN